MKRVLFALLGTSPSVKTETIWALSREDPAVIPDRVVALTTTIGRESVIQALLSGKTTGWQRLLKTLERDGHNLESKLRFGDTSESIRLFPSPCGTYDLEDIATSAHNDAAADFIMRELRGFTENPETSVLASIAGGRKTMSALLMSCMSLLGRRQDRVLHVLVNSPYDTPVEPQFLFPEKGVKYKTRTGESIAVRPEIELIDVPFVRMRGWYEDSFKSAPPSYERLVAGVQRQAPVAVNAPYIELNAEKGTFIVGGCDDVHLSATEFAVIWLLLKGDMAIGETIMSWKKSREAGFENNWLDRLSGSSRFTYEDSLCDDVTKCMSDTRKKIRKHFSLKAFVDALVPKRNRAPSFPKGKIKFKGADPFSDIRGYPK